MAAIHNQIDGKNEWEMVPRPRKSKKLYSFALAELITNRRRVVYPTQSIVPEWTRSHSDITTSIAKPWKE